MNPAPLELTGAPPCPRNKVRVARQLSELPVLLSQVPVVRWTYFWQGWMVARGLGHVDIYDFFVWFFGGLVVFFA